MPRPLSKAGNPRVDVLIAASLVLAPAVAGSRTWHVRPDGSGDVRTIQAGVDSADAGDTVLVGPGTYTWTSQETTGDALIHMDADILLKSEAGASATILDAEGHASVLDCFGVGNARVDGFTVTGGETGIHATGNSQLTIANCIVRTNGGESGGGIFCDATAITHCEILDNSAGGGPSGYGGGISCFNSVIVGCLIRGNRAIGQGAGGGGTMMWDSTMRNCRIEGNWASGTLAGGGGGVAANGTGVRDSIVSCTFVGNRAGAASALSARGMSIVDCVFFGNEAYSEGGTVTLDDCDMTRCTVAFNIGDGYPTPIGGVWVSGPDTTVHSTIVAWNEGRACYGSGTWICCDFFANSSGDATCGVDGGGNTSVDPQFCAVDPAGSENFSLQADSPCAPGNHPTGAPCELIGAVPVGCAVVPIEATTWSRLKCMFR